MILIIAQNGQEADSVAKGLGLDRMDYRAISAPHMLKGLANPKNEIWLVRGYWMLKDWHEKWEPEIMMMDEKDILIYKFDDNDNNAGRVSWKNEPK